MISVCIIQGRETRITSDHISRAKVVCALISFLNRPMHMAQILEMCIYSLAAAGFMCLIREDWPFWLSYVQKDWVLEGLKLFSALNAICLS